MITVSEETLVDYEVSARIATEAFGSKEVLFSAERIKWLNERSFGQGTTIDQYLTRTYLVCSSRLRHRVGEISRELYRKPRRLCVAHSECSLAWRLPTAGLELIDQQWPAFDFGGAHRHDLHL